MILNLPEKIKETSSIDFVIKEIERKYRQTYKIKVVDVKFEEYDRFQQIATAVVQPDFEDEIIGKGSHDLEELLSQVYTDNRTKK